MHYHYILLICYIGSVKGQLGYPKDVPSKQLGYEPLSQKYETLDEEQNENEGIQGVPGQDYPIFEEVPTTGFNCNDQKYPGYYADQEARCQVFHVCQRGGQKDSFLCPKGTIFNQEYLVCDWWFNVDCNKAVQLYTINEMIFNAMEEANVKGNGFELQAYKNNQNYEDSIQKNNYDAPSFYSTENSAIKQEYGTPAEQLTSNGYHHSAPKPQYGTPTERLINNGTPKPVYGPPSAKLINGSPKLAYGVPSQKFVNANNQNGGSPKPVYGTPDKIVNGIYSSKFSGVVSQINSLAESNKFNGYDQNKAVKVGNINNAYLPPNDISDNGIGSVTQSSFGNGGNVETDADDEAIDLLQPVAELEALKEAEPSRSYLPPV